MKRKKLLLILVIVFIASFALFTGCNEKDPVPNPPNVIIDQSKNPMATVPLGNAADFVILAGSKISNVPTSAVTGDIGLSPAAGSNITGFGLAEVTGTIYPAGTRTDNAKVDLLKAYNDAKGRTSPNIVTLAGNIGGLTLTPGLYKSTSTLAISSGDLTFDGNGVYIIQIASSLTTTSDRKVILAGGALASNIFWQVGSSATFGTTSVFKGTVLAQASISFNTEAKLDGRAFAYTGGVTLISNTIVKQ